MALDDLQWTCRHCGQVFTGLPPGFGFEASDNWAWPGKDARSSRLDDGRCLIVVPGGECQRFIQARMDFPGIGFGICIDVWMSVSAASFEALDGSAPGPPLEGCFGYLGNEIPGFPGSRDLPADLWFRSGEAVVVLHNADHALVRAQRDGISLDAVIFLAEFLHD